MPATLLPARLVSLEMWIGAISSSACIGFTSLVPWIFGMTFFEQSKARKGLQTRNSRMDYLLSFSVGAILGDIFFHLVPESLESHILELNVSNEIAHRRVGLSIVAGLFVFIIVEIILERWSNQDGQKDSIAPTKTDKFKDTSMTNECKDLTKILYTNQNDAISVNNNDYNNNNNNNNIATHCEECFSSSSKLSTTGAISSGADKSSPENVTRSRRKNSKTLDSLADRAETPSSCDHSTKPDISKLSAIEPAEVQIIDPAGYLSLIANGIDNFTHGLAIGASFLAGPKVGFLTTFVIFIHEIPHEICDYAILVNSGFSRWNAVKAQSSVSLFGVMGTATALYFKSIDSLNAKTIWILPFSAGGFLHIALVNLLPTIMSRRTNFRDSLEQIGCVTLGIIFMGAVALA